MKSMIYRYRDSSCNLKYQLQYFTDEGLRANFEYLSRRSSFNSIIISNNNWQETIYTLIGVGKNS